MTADAPQEDESRAIFEATSDGMIIASMDGKLVDVNPALCRMHGYSRREMLRLYPTEFIHPDYHAVFARYMASLNAGRSYRTTALDIRKDGTVFPVEVNGTVFTYRGRRHVLGVVRDVSEQVQVEEQLREREEHYRRIFESTSDGLIINDPTRGVVVEANPAVCRMHGYSYEEFIGLHATSFIHPDYHYVFDEFLETIVAGGTYQCEAVNLRKDGTPVPIETHGSSVMYQGKQHILAVVRDITERVQARALLEQRVEERTRELATLLDVSRHVASTLQLQPLLNLILDQLGAVVDYTGAGISVREGAEVRIIGYRGPGSRQIALETHLPVKSLGPLWRLLERSEPTVIADVQGDSPEARIYRQAVGAALKESFGHIRSWMAVPMQVKDRYMGSLFLEHGEPNKYSEHHADLALAIARQATIAIENARLYEKAQEAAVLEERQRISRELHDSVSQALYSIALGARTARNLLERDPPSAVDPLEFVLSQAERGLAEMRALILELRPEALEQEGLVAALQKQVDALQARYQIRVEVALSREPETLLPIKEALYRVAQEALHNTIKHAQASQVHLRLTCAEDEIILEVRDNGKGFDTEGSFPGHLGLQSMRERALQAGGTLEVASIPGHGTCIHLRIPARTPEGSRLESDLFA